MAKVNVCVQFLIIQWSNFAETARWFKIWAKGEESWTKKLQNTTVVRQYRLKMR